MCHKWRGIKPKSSFDKLRISTSSMPAAGVRLNNFVPQNYSLTDLIPIFKNLMNYFLNLGLIKTGIIDYKNLYNETNDQF